jgi:putative flippase GtrA
MGAGGADERGEAGAAATTLARTKMRAQLAEIGRFGIVGGSAVATDFCVYFALVTFVPAFPTSVAKAISFIAGAVLAFVFNRAFVFRAEGAAKTQVLPFTLLYLVSLGLNNGVNAALLSWGAAKVVAWFFATGTSTVSNFVGMKFIVFRSKKTHSEKAP